ncbi:SDR family oxidoreductase [Pseudarthrobacter sp. R1]|uniref:SDR family NAD(P)-dependent oxidoreductase n=1 Tax=Pseudarthrobacter sp. R1 TaxID=2944934 RepID=UPI0021092BB7|nr:SDR family NAD(P)-dependent oxidoreductase [Pseudarthrobacter sp. R1]MCQ6273342.1 SDR family oxidoreductase [Pseudarthrobacter sp. R1]
MSNFAIPGIRLDGRVAIITGAARGMGAAHARTLASRGCELVLADLDEVELDAVAEEIEATYGRRAVTLGLDITAGDAGQRLVDAAVGTWDGLDILVHNAGLMHDWQTLAKTPAANLQPYFDVNVLAPYAITRAAVPVLRNSSAPRIIFISSQWGQVPDGHSYGYMTSKAAQLSLMKALSRELITDNILVNAVAPGAILTRMVPDDAYDEELAAVPLGRLGDPHEIAAAVAFLASDSAAFITGQTISVNGGALIPGA